MNLNEIIDLPIVKAAIQQKAEQEVREAVEARSAVINQIEEIEARLAPLEKVQAMRKADAEKARLAHEEAGYAAFVADNDLSSLRCQQHHLRVKLRKEHGERFVVEAITKLNAYRGHLLSERDRLSGIATRIVETMPGYFVKRENPKASVDLEEVNQRLILVNDALNCAMKLEHARLSPGELQEQAKAVLMSVPAL